MKSRSAKGIQIEPSKMLRRPVDWRFTGLSLPQSLLEGWVPSNFPDTLSTWQPGSGIATKLHVIGWKTTQDGVESLGYITMKSRSVAHQPFSRPRWYGSCTTKTGHPTCCIP